MAHALGMRATSLAGSAGFLALLVAAALSVTYTAISPPQLPTGPVVEITPEPIVPPPPEPTRTRPPPPAPPTEPARSTVDPVTPQPPQPPTETGPVGPAQPPYVTVTNPMWLQTPRNLARYFPARALAMGREGQVVLDCAVGTDGRLSCAVVSETPPGWGFGEAALRISRDYRMTPAMRDGVAVEGRYRMRVPFNIR